jgi:GNAT superfamily N-acetyltransferase
VGIRELGPGETHLAAIALLELRPGMGDVKQLVERVDEVQRQHGYRLLGSFVDGQRLAVAAAGFRVAESLHQARHLYVDDLVCVREHRGQGHATALLRRLEQIARAEGCGAIELDSGVGSHRVDAHRLYFAHGMRITSFHFSRDLEPRG